MRIWMTAAALGGAMLGGFPGIAAEAQSSAQPAPLSQPDAPVRPAGDDGDVDGPVTRDDAAAEADRRFALIDTNHDGRLTPEERQAFRAVHHPDPAPPPLASADEAASFMERSHRRDRDRVETQAEFRERALKRFDRVDTNHDGRIDAREREAVIARMRARVARHHGHDMPPPPAPPAPPDTQ